MTTYSNELMYPHGDYHLGGFTKREFFALGAYIAFLSREDWRNRGLLEIATNAVDAADCLVARLNAEPSE